MNRRSSEKLLKPFKTDVATVGFKNPTYSPNGRLKLKPPSRLNAANIAWALPTNKTKDVGRILESDVIRAFVGYEYPTYSPKGRLKT